MNEQLIPKCKHVVGKKNESLEKQIRISLMYLGFDYSDLGSQYLNEVMVEIMREASQVHSFTSNVIKTVACKYMHTISAIERNIRTSIKKAFDGGRLNKLSCFLCDKPPTIKQLINFLFDFFKSFDYSE